MAKPQPKPKSSKPKSSKPQPKPTTTAVMSPKDVGQSQEAEAALTKRDLLSYMNLTQGSSDTVGDKTATPGEYVLNKTNNVGEEFYAVVGISRPRAMIFEDRKLVLDTFDAGSEEWARCRATKKGGSTGIEFLLYNPDYGAFTYYFKNTSKPEGAKAVACRQSGCWAKFTAKQMDGKSGPYYVPVVETGDALEESDLPKGQAWDEAVAQFDSYKSERKTSKEDDAEER